MLLYFTNITLQKGETSADFIVSWPEFKNTDKQISVCVISHLLTANSKYLIWRFGLNKQRLGMNNVKQPPEREIKLICELLLDTL